MEDVYIYVVGFSLCCCSLGCCYVWRVPLFCWCGLLSCAFVVTMCLKSWADSVRSLLLFACVQGRDQEAKELLQRALTTIEKVFGRDHPVAVQLRSVLGPGGWGDD